MGVTHCLMRQSADAVKRARLRACGGGVSANSKLGDDAVAGMHTHSTQWEWPSKVCFSMPSFTRHSFAVLREIQGQDASVLLALFASSFFLSCDPVKTVWPS